MSEAEPPGHLDERSAGIARIGVGLAQGIAIYALTEASEAGGWLHDQPLAWSILIIVTLFVPVLVLGGLGQMRLSRLLVWAGVATLLLVGLEWHDVAREVDTGGKPQAGNSPSIGVIVFGTLTLFIAHHLVAAADQERKIIAAYPRYFEIGWTSAIQIALAVAFTLVFWAILWLGASLLNLIGIKVLSDLLKESWFGIPATCVTFAVAIHATDTRTNLVRGARTLVLALFSWLMPVMVLLAVTFIVSLPFTGLKALWATKQTTPIVLTSAVALTALINAAYQDGGEHRTRSQILRIAGIVGGACLLPLVAIGAYSTYLRIAQYGLTPERVAAVACILVALVYAVGYFLNAIPTLTARKVFERTNVVAAFFSIAVFLALFSPLADPARVAVADQVSRLERGRVAPDKFDFSMLRFSSARYGREAFDRLKTLKEGPRAAAISAAALKAEQQTPMQGDPPLVAKGLPNIRVFPEGRRLPDSFSSKDWRKDTEGRAYTSGCLVDAQQLCDAYLMDFDQDGSEDILLSATGVSRSENAGPEADYLGVVDAYQLGDTEWVQTGRFGNLCDADMRAALRAGKMQSRPRTTFDLQVDGRRLLFVPREADGIPNCRKE